MFKKNTIFTKLFRSYSIIILISFLLFIGVFFYLFHFNLYKGYESAYFYQFEKIEKQIQSQMKLYTSKEEFAESLSYSLDQPDYHIYIIDENRQQIFGPNPEQTNMPFNSISNDMMNKITKGEMVSEGSFQNGELRYIVASPLSFNIEGINTPYMIMIFHDMSHEYKQILLMILLTFTIAMLFTSVIIWFISKKITKPLREMNEIAIHYAKGDFSKSVQYESTDEIGQLAKSFTYMAEELNDLENRRKQFVSNVSHDLRSPLTSIKGFIIALLDGAIPDNQRSHYYHLMKDETERMIKLVNDTLDIARLEEGQHKLIQRHYNLTDQINLIIYKLEPQFKKKNLNIRFKQAHSSCYVYADKERIEQVIINLLQNAIQFSYNNSPIDIQLEPIGTQVKITIQDYGVGIKKEQLHAIWKRFYKTDEARTNKTGFGLGLAIVKSILDSHESKVTVNSETGQGTRFSFTLPASKSQ